MLHWWESGRLTGLKIVTDMVAIAARTFFLATKSLGLVTTFVTSTILTLVMANFFFEGRQMAFGALTKIHDQPQGQNGKSATIRKDQY